MNVLCKTIYLSQEDKGLYILKDEDSLPTSDWENEDTPDKQFKKYIKLDPQWAVIELADTKTEEDTISIIFVCILPPQTELLAGEWKPITDTDFNQESNPIVYKAIQKL